MPLGVRAEYLCGEGIKDHLVPKGSKIATHRAPVDESVPLGHPMGVVPAGGVGVDKEVVGEHFEGEQYIRRKEQGQDQQEDNRGGGRRFRGGRHGEEEEGQHPHSLEGRRGKRK